LVASANGGEPCGELIEYRDCNTQACPEDPHTVLSNYALIAEQEIHLHSSNKVESGGLGVTNEGGKIKLHHFSYVADFAKASKIETHIWSWVGERIYSPADVEVPDFIYNTSSNKHSGDVRISYNKTKILDGEVYGKVEIQDRATVSFTGSNIYLDELIVNSNATVEFTGCANIFISKKLVLGYNSTFNLAANAVKVFVDGDVLVLGGSTVTAQIQSTKQIHAMGWFYRSINMNGLFIARKIHGFINVNWNKFEFPSPCEINGPAVSENNDEDCDDDRDQKKKTKSGEINSETFTSIELKMWPNPTPGMVHIDISGEEIQPVKVTVFNMAGAKVLQKEFQAGDNIIFDMSQHISGMYLVRIETNGFETIKKLVLDRR